MPFTQWRNRKERAKQNLKILQMLTLNGVVRKGEVELRYGISHMKDAASLSSKDRIPYGLYLSGKASSRNTP